MNQKSKIYVNWKGYRKYLKFMGIFWGLGLLSSIALMFPSTQEATGFFGKPAGPVLQFFFWSILGLIWVLFFGLCRFIVGKPLQGKGDEPSKNSKMEI